MVKLEEGYAWNCFEVSPIVNSMGIWDKTTSSSSMSPSFLTYKMAILNTQLLVLFCVTQATHFCLKRVGFIQLSSQMIAGIILGPLVLGRTNIIRQVIFPPTDQRDIRTLGVIGYVFFIFINGVKMDMNMVRKTGKKTMVLGLVSCVPALLLCNAIKIYFLKTFTQQLEGEDNYLTLIMAIQSYRSFPVIASLLGELKILNSEIGRLALSAAVISELFSDTTSLLYRLYFSYTNGSLGEVITEVCKLIGFLAFVAFVFRPTMIWIVKRTPQGRAVKDKYTNYIILFMIAFVIICNKGLRITTLGSFILGLVIPSGSPLGSTLEKKLDSFCVYFLLPLHATIIGMKLDFLDFSFHSNAIKYSLTVFVLPPLIVFLLCYGVARYCKIPSADATVVSLILMHKGIYELASISVLRDEMSLSGDMFEALFLNILASTIVIPAMIRYLYNPSRKYGGYQKRNIMHLKDNDEMKVVTIIHRPDNVNTSINLLDAFGPSSDGPIRINVLHLIEQVGQAMPIFISHKIQTKTASNYSYSGDVIQSFTRYQTNYQPGTVDVDVYTSISPPRMMHEDVCNLALNKLASFIILPFHRKRSMMGRLESEFNSLRPLNKTILDKGPCSVGIFIDNGGFENQESRDAYNVGMIFIGGNDDREALSLAKRMARDNRISLSILHLTTTDDGDNQATNNWGKMLDNEVLKEFMMTMQDSDNVNYAEKVVKDGPETAFVVQSILEDNEFHLIIVGRHYKVEWTQTSGLISEWSDFPELGALGDLLASYEINAKTSVLVVQQQRLAESKARINSLY